MSHIYVGPNPERVDGIVRKQREMFKINGIQNVIHFHRHGEPCMGYKHIRIGFLK